VRSIQWRQAEVLQYNPNFPAAHPSLIPAKQPLTPMSFNTAINPPFFPPAPTPQPLIAPSPNPFYNQHGSQRAINSQLTIGQTQPKTPHTNAFNPINPFIQINPNFHYHKSANRNNSRNTKWGRKTQKHPKPYQGAYFTGWLKEIIINKHPGTTPTWHKKPTTSKNTVWKTSALCQTPNYPWKKNFDNGLRTKPSCLFRQPSNLTYHDLCGNENIPTGTKQLLGLNLKYCLTTNRLNNNINKTVQKMAYSIRTKLFLDSIGLPTNQEYEKQIYVKNRSWNPPPASLFLENKITEFKKELKKSQTTLLKSSTELT